MKLDRVGRYNGTREGLDDEDSWGGIVHGIVHDEGDGEHIGSTEEWVALSYGLLL